MKDAEPNLSLMSEPITTKLTIIGAVIGGCAGLRITWDSMITSHEPIGHAFVGIMMLGLGTLKGTGFGAVCGALLYPALVTAKRMAPKAGIWAIGICQKLVTRASNRPRPRVSATDVDEVHKAVGQIEKSN